MPREREEDELVAKPISFGINAPHCCTSHADCKLTSQRSTITMMIQRVKSGRRKIYERARAAENWGRLGGMVSIFEAGWIRGVGVSNEVLREAWDLRVVQSLEGEITSIVVAGLSHCDRLGS